MQQDSRVVPGPSTGTFRVLFIGDNGDIGAQAMRQLRSEFPHVEVHEIHNPDSLKRAIEVGDFEAVITDNRLRWTDGFAILREVKLQLPDRPVIMLIEADSEELAAEAMKTGLDDYVLKSSEHLIRLPASVRSIINRAHERRALREAEKRYRGLFQRAPIGLYRIDDRGEFIDVNPALVQMLGYPSRESLLAVNFFDLDRDSEARRNWRVIIERDGTAPRFQFQLSRYNGKSLWVEDSAVAVRDPFSQKLCYEGILKDLTEHKRIERQYQQAQKMQAIGTLAGGIAHDFNNILSAVFGYTQMALMSLPQGDPLRQSLEQVLTAGTRAKELVKSILAFSRHGEQRLQTMQVGLIVKETLKLLRASLPSTIEIRQTLKSSPYGWDTIKADPSQINQILMNLCTNAAQAMGEKGGVLEVILSEVDLDSDFPPSYPDLKSGMYLMLTVKDTGCGMEPGARERIFEPFFTAGENGQASGTGLSVVYGIVASYGGTMRAESEPGEGSAFHVLLPRIGSQIPAVAREPGPIPGGEERILFVDDEKVLVDVGRQMLSRLGYHVVALESSTEALRIFAAQPDAFDLMITDLTMPQMTGVELAEEVMRIRPGMPIILCTGFTDLITPEKAEAQGIRGFLRKPFILRLLAETVRRVLSG